MMNLAIITAMAMAIAAPTVYAEDITDTVTDVEEITADSDAARERAHAAAEEVARQRAENARALKEAYRTRKEAEAKRQQAATTIQQSELELDRMAVEQRRTQKDIDKLQFNILAAERIIQKQQEKIDQRKQDITALEAQRKEKADRLEALNKEQMEFVRTASAAADEQALLKQQLEKMSNDEIVTAKKFEKIKADADAKRVELEKAISELKERYRQLREQRYKAHMDAYNARKQNQRLEQTLKAGQVEVENAAAAKPAEPQASNDR